MRLLGIFVFREMISSSTTHKVFSLDKVWNGLEVRYFYFEGKYKGTLVFITSVWRLAVVAPTTETFLESELMSVQCEHVLKYELDTRVLVNKSRFILAVFI